MAWRALALLATLAACASAPAAGLPVTGEYQVRLNATAAHGALRVTPLSIAEESRCPIGVQCIQAGTIRIEARVADASGTSRRTLELGEPLALAGGWAELVRACPHPARDLRIAPADYRFTLLIGRGSLPAPAPQPRGC